MADEAVSFDAASAQRIADAVRWVEAQTRRPGGVRAAQPLPAREHQIIRVTSGTPDGDGYYPAEVVVYDLDLDDWVAQDGDALAVGIWAETLSANAYYLATSIGEASGGEVLYQVVPSPLQVVTSQSGTQDNVWQLSPDGSTGILSSAIADGRVSIYGQAATATLWGMVTPNDQEWDGVKSFQDHLRALNGIRVATGGSYGYPLAYLEASDGAKITHHADASFNAYWSLTAGSGGDGINEAGFPVLKVITTDNDRPVLEISAGAGGGGTVNGLEGDHAGFTFIAGWAVDYDGSLDSVGDVTGPGSSTDNAIARFDGTTGKVIQNSGITIADGATGTLSGTNTGDQTITLTGDVTGSGTGSFAATIANNAVTDAKLRDSGACSVIGRSANSSGDPADISAASNGIFLGRRSDVVGFYNPGLDELRFRGAWAYAGSGQSCANATYTAIDLASEYLDTDSYHSTVSNTSRLTAPHTGRYLVGGAVTMPVGVDNYRLALRANGSSYVWFSDWQGFGGIYTTPLNIVGIFNMSAGDYIELALYNGSGGSRTVQGANFWMIPLGVT